MLLPLAGQFQHNFDQVFGKFQTTFFKFKISPILIFSLVWLIIESQIGGSDLKMDLGRLTKFAILWMDTAFYWLMLAEFLSAMFFVCHLVMFFGECPQIFVTFLLSFPKIGPLAQLDAFGGGQWWPWGMPSGLGRGRWRQKLSCFGPSIHVSLSVSSIVGLENFGRVVAMFDCCIVTAAATCVSTCASLMMDLKEMLPTWLIVVSTVSGWVWDGLERFSHSDDYVLGGIHICCPMCILGNGLEIFWRAAHDFLALCMLFFTLSACYWVAFGH